MQELVLLCGHGISESIAQNGVNIAWSRAAGRGRGGAAGVAHVGVLLVIVKWWASGELIGGQDERVLVIREMAEFLVGRLFPHVKAERYM